MRSFLEIEEILLDQEKKSEIQKPLSKKRLLFLYFLIFICFFVLLIRTADLQIVRGNYYRKLAEENMIMAESIPGLRGVIYDTNGRQLASNTLNLKEKNVRQYFDGPILAHIIGYTNSENLGQTGLELVYQEYLKGEDGKKRIEVNSLGQNQRTIALQEPVSGNNLVLNIDFDLQKKLYDTLPESPSAGVILDSTTGGVLALVSKPSFDNNLLSQGISEADYQKLIQDPQKPLFNRAISGQYPPGSTIKPLMASAALEEKVIDPWKEITDVPYLEIRNQYNPDIVYKFPDWKDHGKVNMVKAIQESCNIYFYRIGEKLGWRNIKKYASIFNLGSTLGIDLPNEAKGFVPEQGWLGDLYHTAIGQGDLTATVLQINAYTAAIASNGRLYQPQIVDKIVDSDNNLVKDILPKILKSNFIQEKNLEIIQQGMDQGYDHGKTGTAQFTSEKDKYRAWYTSYKDNLVITILVEQGISGQQNAMPIAREIYKWYDSNQ
ncbi:MAG: penicillin-binding transpeptidase domain-containing protein [bacterium]